jgi:hypothetical protein
MHLKLVIGIYTLLAKIAANRNNCVRIYKRIETLNEYIPCRTDAG